MMESMVPIAIDQPVATKIYAMKMVTVCRSQIVELDVNVPSVS